MIWSFNGMWQSFLRRVGSSSGNSSGSSSGNSNISMSYWAVLTHLGKTSVVSLDPPDSTNDLTGRIMCGFDRSSLQIQSMSSSSLSDCSAVPATTSPSNVLLDGPLRRLAALPQPLGASMLLESKRPGGQGNGLGRRGWPASLQLQGGPNPMLRDCNQ